jgi:hypothetical protein
MDIVPTGHVHIWQKEPKSIMGSKVWFDKNVYLRHYYEEVIIFIYIIFLSRSVFFPFLWSVACSIMVVRLKAIMLPEWTSWCWCGKFSGHRRQWRTCFKGRNSGRRWGRSR